MNARPVMPPFARNPVSTGKATPRRVSTRAAMRRVVCAVGIALIAYLVCFPITRPVTLDVGQIGDRLTLTGVNGDERDLGITYRWSTTRTVFAIPGYGGVRTARVIVTTRGGRADANGRSLTVPVPFTVDTGGAATTLPAGAAWTAATADLARAPGGDALPVTLRAARYPVMDDPRVLGVQVDRIRVEPLATNWIAGVRGGWTWAVRLALFAATVALIVPLPDTSGGRRSRGSGGLDWLGGGAAIIVALLTVALPEARLIALPLLLPATAVIAAGGALWHGRSAVGWLAARRPVLRAWANPPTPQPPSTPSDEGGWVGRSIEARIRPATLARAIVGAVIVGYVMVALLVITRAGFIGHADYADNAVRARNLVTGRGDVVDYLAQFYRTYPTTITHPAETWPPLQVWMIALAFRLLGVSMVVAKVPNLVVMAGMLALVAGIGAWRWERRVGVLAVLLLASSLPFFAGALVPENDLVFTLLFACFAVALHTAWVDVADVAGTTEAAAHPSRYLSGSALVGLTAAVLVLAKPSGAVLVLGAAGAAWCVAQRQGRRVPGVAALVTLGIAALVYAPWAVRNIVTFGTPFFSTESLDAWVLKYDPKQPTEGIYRVFTDKPLPHPRALIGYGYDHFFAVQGREIARFWSGVVGGGWTHGALVPGIVLALAVVGVVIGASRRAGFGVLLMGAFVPYTAFVLLYWHYEARYLLVLVPWVLLYAAAGLVWLTDALATHTGRAGRVLGPLVALALMLAVVVPGFMGIAAEARAQTDASDPVAIGRWIAANTPPDAVVMTRNPWEMSWHSGRRAVMLPLGTTDEIYATMRQYHVTVLALDHLNDQNTIRDGIRSLGLYSWRESPGFTHATYNPDAAGTATYLIYRVDPAALPGG